MFSKVLRFDYAPQHISMAINSGDIVWMKMQTFSTRRVISFKFNKDKEVFHIEERNSANFTEMEVCYLDLFTKWSNYNDLLVEMNA